MQTCFNHKTANGKRATISYPVGETCPLCDTEKRLEAAHKETETAVFHMQGEIDKLREKVDSLLNEV